MNDLVGCPPNELHRYDIAAVNLGCAEGLPGAEGLDATRCLRTIDAWTAAVKNYTRDSKNDYQLHPEEFHHHRGFFSFVCMVTVLKHPRGIGISYQPSAIGNYRFLDSRDDLLHGLLTRKLGTCASLPVLFVAIGRRLGYPMHLAISNGHVFCQWVDRDGSRVNLEGSCPGGGEMYPDEHYQQFPHPLNPAHLASGRYLRPLTPAEELALFLETRGHCFMDNGRLREAREAYEQALRAAPSWSLSRAFLGQLEDKQRRSDGQP